MRIIQHLEKMKTKCIVYTYFVIKVIQFFYLLQLTYFRR